MVITVASSKYIRFILVAQFFNSDNLQVIDNNNPVVMCVYFLIIRIVPHTSTNTLIVFLPRTHVSFLGKCDACEENLLRTNRYVGP